MTYKELDKILAKAGHTTKEQSNFKEPVTLTGDYEAENGYFYRSGFDSRMTVLVAREGKSTALILAERKAYEKVGHPGSDWSSEDEDLWCSVVLQKLGLAAK